MARPPKSTNANPPMYVNLRGEPIDLLKIAGVYAGGGNPPEPRAKATDSRNDEPAKDPSPTDVDTVFDALCLAGSTRTKVWLAAFLNALECDTSDGEPFTAGLVEKALRKLREAKRLVEVQGLGYDVAAEVREQNLPSLLTAPGVDKMWVAFARATPSSLHPHGDEPSMPQFRTQKELVAFARLVIYGGLSAERYQRVSLRVMGPSRDVEVLAQALNSPFIPQAFAAMQRDFRDLLMQQLLNNFRLRRPEWDSLLDWFDDRLAQAPDDVPLLLRFSLSEARLHLGDLEAARRRWRISTAPHCL